jgi:hypothetical protein
MRQQLPYGPADLPALLDHWVAAGVITDVQAARMRTDLGLLTPAPNLTVLPVRAPQPVRTPLVVEALGYLGGVIILVASILLTAQYWSDLATWAHLSIVAIAALVLVLSGLAVPERLGMPGRRLRAVLWFAATGATAAFFALLAWESFDWHAEDVAQLSTAGAAVLAAALWWRRRSSILQQLALIGTLAGTAAAATAQLHPTGGQLPGVAVWGVGAVWFLLGWGGLLRPQRVALAFGAIGLLVGSAITMLGDEGLNDAGIAFALLTVVAIVAAAVLFRDLVLLAIGAWGALQTLPSAIGEWFPNELAAPLVLLGVGALLVAGALYIARRRTHTESGPPAHDYSSGPVRIAVGSAAGVAAAVTAFVLVAGLL